jgi:hypothetical protein
MAQRVLDIFGEGICGVLQQEQTDRRVVLMHRKMQNCQIVPALKCDTNARDKQWKGRTHN